MPPFASNFILAEFIFPSFEFKTKPLASGLMIILPSEIKTSFEPIKLTLFSDDIIQKFSTSKEIK